MGETCKLCLKFIQGESVAALDEELLSKLEFIQMNLERSVEESNSVCTECKGKIHDAFDFKFCLVQTENSEPGASGSQAQASCDIPSTSSGETSAEKTICRTCKNSVSIMAVISLEKLLKDDNVMEIFQGHIPELELKSCANSMVCEPCQKALASFSMLVSSWSIANDWNDEDDEDMKDDMDAFNAVEVKKESDDFSDSNTNSSCISDSVKIVKKAKGNQGQVTKVKTEGDEVSDSSESVSVMKKEEKEEDEEGDLQLKNEEVDIKDEDGRGTAGKGFTSFTEHFNHKASNAIAEISHLHVCHKCGFQAINEKDLLDHLIVHQRPQKPKIYTCKECSFKSKHRRTLKVHWLKHKDPNEKETYKCQYCSYESNLKQCVAEHSRIHLDSKLLYSCDFCSFQTKFRYAWRKHRQRAHDLGIVVNEKAKKKPDKNFKCHLCEFETHKKNSLVKHVLVHRKIDEVETFKCPECSYKTKYKSSLTRHSLTHKSYDEVVTFQCTYCSFRCKCQRNMRRHTMLHQRGHETDILKCSFCTYTSKKQGLLASHIKKIHSDKGTSDDQPVQKKTKTKRDKLNPTEEILP